MGEVVELFPGGGEEPVPDGIVFLPVFFGDGVTHACAVAFANLARANRVCEEVVRVTPEVWGFELQKVGVYGKLEVI